MGAINWTSGDIKKRLFDGRRSGEKAIGVQGLRGLDSRHLILFFLLYSHDYEFEFVFSSSHNVLNI